MRLAEAAATGGVGSGPVAGGGEYSCTSAGPGRPFPSALRARHLTKANARKRMRSTGVCYFLLPSSLFRASKAPPSPPLKLRLPLLHERPRPLARVFRALGNEN